MARLAAPGGCVNDWRELREQKTEPRRTRRTRRRMDSGSTSSGAVPHHFRDYGVKTFRLETLLGVLRFVVKSFFLLCLACVGALTCARSHAVEYSDLAKYWTPDAQHVPYRAITTPGREHGERLPLIVFLH